MIDSGAIDHEIALFPYFTGLLISFSEPLLLAGTVRIDTVLAKTYPHRATSH
jgi:hypothetical protein